MSKLKQVALIQTGNRQSSHQLIRGVVAYAQREGTWDLFVVEGPADDLPDFRIWHGKGIIACFDRPRVAAAVSWLNIPVVGLEGIVKWDQKFEWITRVVSDNPGIGRFGAEHLLNQGHTQLAYCGQPRSRFSRWSAERGSGFEERAEEAGIPCYTYTGRFSSNRHWPQLGPELIEWLRSLPKPVGLMACNDPRARQVLQACQNAEIHVPEDIAVLGVDNDEILCEVTRPPLSSIAVGWDQMGYQAAELLDRLMNGEKNLPKRILIGPEGVIARQSTDALAVQDADVAAALRLIRAHACRGITAREVAEDVGISRSTLYKRFKAIYGCTIHMEVQRVRLQRARELIYKTDLPLKQIAVQAGFANAEHMSRLFRQHLGRPPGKYRS